MLQSVPFSELSPLPLPLNLLWHPYFIGQPLVDCSRLFCFNNYGKYLSLNFCLLTYRLD